MDDSLTIESSANILHKCFFSETATLADCELQLQKSIMPSKVRELLGIIFDIPCLEVINHVICNTGIFVINAD